MAKESQVYITPTFCFYLPVRTPTQAYSYHPPLPSSEENTKKKTKENLKEGG